MARNLPGDEYMGDLAFRLTHDDKFNPEQLTLSLDNEPTSVGLYAMQRLAEELRKMENPPGFYLTFRDEMSGAHWSKAAEKLGIGFEPKAVAFSNVTNPSFMGDILVNKDRKMTVGFNLLAGEETPELLEIISLFDFIYLLVRKPKLGQRFKQEDIEQWFRTRETLDKAGITYVQDKCMENAYNVATGVQEGCHAGISIKTVWPDGQETGCPYNSNGIEENGGACHACHLPSALQEYWKGKE